MEYWHIVFWEDNGVCRVDRDLLKKMKTRENFLFESLGEKMSQYTARTIDDVRYHQDLEKVKNEDDMWELKFHLRKAEIRFLGCLVDKDNITTFYALYAFRKKNQEILSKHIKTARDRVISFISEYKKENGLQRIL